MSSNEYLNDGFEFWQTFTQSYTNFMFEMMQQSVDQTLALRERMDQMMVDTVNKVEALNAQERSIALDVAAQANLQAQAAAEQATETFKALSAVLTAPLFSDWASARASQIAKPVSASNGK